MSAMFSPFASLLRKELSGRRPLLLAALLLGCLPFALPLLPQARGQSPAELREAAMAVTAVLGALLLTVMLGADLLSRELAERRMGFYFSRPLTAKTLLLAKLAAAYAVLVAGCALLVGPVALVDRPDWQLPGLTEAPPAVAAAASVLGVLGALLLALLLVSTLAVLVRARSAWLAVDLLSVALAALVVAFAALRLQTEGARQALAVGAALFGLAAIAALTLAHHGAVANGRTDALAARRALSARLWGLLVPAAAGFALFAAWVLSPSPADLTSISSAQPSPQGPWVAVGGLLRGRFGFSAVFLWNSETGRFVRLRGTTAEDPSRSVAFSADGRTAAWAERDGAQWSVWELDLAGSEPPRRTTVTYPSWPTVLALSPHGRNLAARSGGRWLLEDPVAGRLLASAVDAAYTEGLRWIGDDRIRIFDLSGFDRPQVEVRIWDLAATPGTEPGAGLVTPFIEILTGGALLKPSPDGRRVLLHDNSGWSLFDIATHSRLGGGSTGPERLTYLPDARLPGFLPDGRILMSRRNGQSSTLELADADGRALRSYAIENPGRFWLCGQPERDTVLALLVRAPSARRVAGESVPDQEHGLVSLDLASGAMRRHGHGLWPAQCAYGANDAPSGDAARWLLSEDGRLLTLAADGTPSPRLGPGTEPQR